MTAMTTTTLEKLAKVGSQLVRDMLAYYEALIDHLDRAPWPRQKQFIRASEIAIPARVLKEGSNRCLALCAGVRRKTSGTESLRATWLIRRLRRSTKSRR